MVRTFWWHFKTFYKTQNLELYINWKAYGISNNIHTRCISPKRSSAVISHFVFKLAQL